MQCREVDILIFVEERDGKKGAVAFAKQGIVAYRRTILKSRTMYRDKMIESYVCFKRYIRTVNLLGDK